MQSTALGHRLETLHDGLTTFREGEPVPVPLVATTISIRVVSGLAFVRTTRIFRNAEDDPIEAVMTFPVGFEAVVTGLAATVDGRRMIGVAKERAEARETYETALDEGKLSVLHEEALRGIHVLSVGALPPGAEAQVELEQVLPLADAGGVPFLRLPMTAGQLYGTSPLLPSDDLTTAGVRHVADLSVKVDAGRAVLEGQVLAPDEAREVLLDRALELRIEGGGFGAFEGIAADGRQVRLTLAPVGAGDAPLDLHVMVDRSGSTDSPVREGMVSVWEAMRDGLTRELETLRSTDRVSLWQFDSGCEWLGEAHGPSASALVRKLKGPRGGTELAGAIRAAIEKGAKDILVLTDGQTWAHLVEDLKAEGTRISAILAGPGSLDANIGHLCALTGGQVLYAPGRDVASALRSAFAALRQVGAAVEGTMSETGAGTLTMLRGGVRLRAEWSAPEPVPASVTASAGEQDDTIDCLAIGRFAAALALPLLPTEQAEAFARAHSLCTHMTSLVLVDDAGEATQGFSRMRKVPLMANPSLAPRMMASMPAFDANPHAILALDPMASPGVRNARMPEARPRLAPGRKSALSSAGRPTPISSEAALDDAPGNGTERRTRETLDRDRPAFDLTLFEGFAWDTHGDALLAGDFRGLSIEQRTAVERLARLIQSACATGCDPNAAIGDVRILALGLIASRSTGRIAERFARRALKDASVWLLSLE